MITLLKFIQICFHIGILYVFYLLGIWIQDLFHLFIPGSVIGLLLLFLCLMLKIIRLEWIEAGATFMVKHIIIFFIPSTVGLMVYGSLLVGKGLFLIVITIISTILVMITSGFVSEKLIRGKSDDIYS